MARALRYRAARMGSTFAGWDRRAAVSAAGVLVALSWACSEDPRPDAGLPIPAEDAQVAPDASEPDAGVPDIGSCGCTYGHHQECGAGDLCMQGYSEPLKCTRPSLDAAAGLACTQHDLTNPQTFLCSAQCVRAAQGVSPCQGMNSAGIVDTLTDWLFTINGAIDDDDPSGWGHMNADAINHARTSSVDTECIEFLGWTVFGLVELCRGLGSTRPVLAGIELEQWEYKEMSSPADDCRIIAGNLCVDAVQQGYEFDGELAAEGLDRIVRNCPAGLPYGPPCAQVGTATTAAQECLKERVRTIIRALRRP